MNKVMTYYWVFKLNLYLITSKKKTAQLTDLHKRGRNMQDSKNAVASLLRHPSHLDSTVQLIACTISSWGCLVATLLHIITLIKASVAQSP